MSRAGTSRGTALFLAALITAGALGACGKRNAPAPPEGEESRYTYPQVYPDPQTVRPAEPEEEARSREVLPHAGDISTYPTSRTRTTYGSGTLE
ncbi:MAG: hypothetical protein V3T80_11155 [Kiloniellales bacterium]